MDNGYRETLIKTQYNDLRYPNGFWPWLQKNKHIYDEFVKLALQMKARGRDRWSARGITEVLRWQTALQSNDDMFKVNNNWSAGMARLAMIENPTLEGFFELRGGH